MKADRVEGLIDLFDETATKIVLEHEDYIDTAQALRQLKQSQETEPLRTEIIEKYNDGYEHGLRRAAEIMRENWVCRTNKRPIDGTNDWVDCYDKDAEQAILNEANNQQGENDSV